MQQLHEKIADMNSRYYDLRGKIVKAERRITTLTERGEMWAQYNEYKTVHKQLARVKPEKRELFEQRHSREPVSYTHLWEPVGFWTLFGVGIEEGLIMWVGALPCILLVVLLNKNYICLLYTSRCV